MSRVLIFMVVVTMFSCKTAATQKGVDKLLNTTEFAEQMEAFEAAGTEFVLLDIRTPQELEETGMIAGADHVDFYQDDFRDNVDKLDKETPVMVYCRSGARSGKSITVFKELGFSEVYDLGGGITGWIAAGKPVEK